MLIDKIISLKINGNNKKYYNNLFNEEFKNGEIIQINQKEVSPSSHILLQCKCEECNKIFERKRKDIKTVTLCNKECRNKNIKNPNPKKDKIKVECLVCKKNIEIHESKYKKQDNFTCSRECYSKHRSLNYNQEKIYNFQNKYTNCKTCNKEVKTSKWYIENKNNIFCSQDCYWSHRKVDYLNSYYRPQLNDSRKETKPEKMVREYLESININFEQEKEMDGYFIDFYLSDYNIAIEVYGDYWHANPSVYGKDKKDLNDMQKSAIKHDRLRNKILKRKLNSMIILWEKDIYEDLTSIMGGTLLKEISQQVTVTTTR